MDIQTGPSPYVLNLTISDTAAHVSSLIWLGGRRIVSFQLVTGGTLDGAWKVEVSNDYAADKDVSMGQNVNAGAWTDVTAGFKKLDGTALAAVAHGTAATQNQFVQCAPIGGKWARVTFTGSLGVGTATVSPAGGDY